MQKPICFTKCSSGPIFLFFLLTFWSISKQTADKSNYTLLQQTLAIEALRFGQHSFSVPSMVPMGEEFEVDSFTRGVCIIMKKGFLKKSCTCTYHDFTQNCDIFQIFQRYFLSKLSAFNTSCHSMLFAMNGNVYLEDFVLSLGIKSLD